MTLQVQIIIVEICLLVTIGLTVYNLFRLQRTITTLWDIVKDLQMRKDLH